MCRFLAPRFRPTAPLVSLPTPKNLIFYSFYEVEIEIRTFDFIFTEWPGAPMGKGYMEPPVLTQYPTRTGTRSMEKGGKAAEEVVTTLVADGLNASKLSTMNPSELFRLAAELGLAIEPMPSPPVQDLRLNRYIE